MPPLSNLRREDFAQRVALGQSALQAYKDAGYKGNSRTLETGSSRLMSFGEIRSRIAEIAAERASKKLVTAAKLHERWSEMFEADIADITDDEGRLKPLKQWPKIWRQMCSSLDVKRLYERSQDGGKRAWDAIGEIVKMKFVSVKDI